MWLICSDEAYFYLKEPVNKQNNRLWLESKPFESLEYSLHNEKVLVCHVMVQAMDKKIMTDNQTSIHVFSIYGIILSRRPTTQY